MPECAAVEFKTDLKAISIYYPSFTVLVCLRAVYELPSSVHVQQLCSGAPEHWKTGGGTAAPAAGEDDSSTAVASAAILERDRRRSRRCIDQFHVAGRPVESEDLRTHFQLQ